MSDGLSDNPGFCDCGPCMEQCAVCKKLRWTTTHQLNGTPQELCDSCVAAFKSLCIPTSEKDKAAVPPEPLPPWAKGRSTGVYLEVGAQLCTRDGRRSGNAVVISHYGAGFVIALTDKGNKIRLTEKELAELFHPPRYIMDLTYDDTKDLP